MKVFGASTIVTLIVALIATYFGYFLSRETADLRYALSERIPTKFINSKAAENIQQLVVKNNGNSGAKNIVIKIRAHINEYDVLKSSLDDKVNVHSLNGHFEIKYFYLPPDAQFTFILKTSGGAIKSDDLEITDNNGMAKGALEGDDTFWADYLTISLILFYFGMVLFSAYDSLVKYASTTGRHKDPIDYLRKNKPIYLSVGKWTEIRKNYIDEFFYLHSFVRDEIEDGVSYKLLNHERPDFITKDEWMLLQDLSVKNLVKTFNNKMFGYFLVSSIEKLLLIKKPMFLSDHKWSEIQGNLNRAYVAVKKYDFANIYALSKMEIELASDPAEGVSQESWVDYKRYALNFYFSKIFSDIYKEQDPIAYLEKANISILSDHEQSILKGGAYDSALLKFSINVFLFDKECFLSSEKPNWMRDFDFERLKKIAELVVESELNGDRNLLIKEALDKLIRLVPLGDKPSSIDFECWEGLKIIEENIVFLSKNNIDERAKLQSLSQDLQGLKEKLVKQLKIIDSLFIDPFSLDKVESYDNPFSDGNFKNLIRISNHLKGIVE